MPTRSSDAQETAMSSAVSGSAPAYHRLAVRAVIDETDDARSLVLELPAALAGQFRYRPGQFLTVRIGQPGQGVRRCYSMSSTPGCDRDLRVTVKRVSGGIGSNWLCDHVRPGDMLEVQAPAGLFTPAALDGDFLLLAGGSGITPVFSILRAVLAGGSGRICLVYANRDERSIIFRSELAELARAHPDRLQVLHWLDSVQGVPTRAQLAQLAAPWRHAQAFICGPAPFMEAAAAALEEGGLAPERIRLERFLSLPDEGIAAPAPVPAPGQAQAEIELSLDGVRHTISCGANETLLDAALRAGIAVPHSCRAGMCASCMCQVVEGEVDLRHNEVLDARDLAKKWTLSCQAVPLGRRVRIKFPE
jgi:3-ketosteroid 9alpha-monooxygenase subunit B